MKCNALISGWLGLTMVCVPLTAATDAIHTGCVTETEAGEYNYCEPNACSLLAGKLLDRKLAGHTVTLRGVVHEATADKPRTIDITKIVAVGGACDEVCSPRPPGHRGIGPHDRPGVEGGTPGRSTGDAH